jgi:DNA repair exonuclease SbcCD ATPase subunit
MPSATVSEAKNYIAHGLRNMCAAHEEEVEALREELKEWKERCCLLQDRLEAVASITYAFDVSWEKSKELIDAEMEARKKRKLD